MSIRKAVLAKVELGGGMASETLRAGSTPESVCPVATKEVISIYDPCIRIRGCVLTPSSGKPGVGHILIERQTLRLDPPRER